MWHRIVVLESEKNGLRPSRRGGGKQHLPVGRICHDGLRDSLALTEQEIIEVAGTSPATTDSADDSNTVRLRYI